MGRRKYGYGNYDLHPCKKITGFDQCVFDGAHVFLYEKKRKTEIPGDETESNTEGCTGNCMEFHIDRVIDRYSDHRNSCCPAAACIEQGSR